MRYFEIETGVKPNTENNWGFQIHEYDDRGFRYFGCEDPSYGCSSHEEAFAKAVEELDARYGKKNWKHI